MLRVCRPAQCAIVVRQAQGKIYSRSWAVANGWVRSPWLCMKTLPGRGVHPGDQCRDESVKDHMKLRGEKHRAGKERATRKDQDQDRVRRRPAGASCQRPTSSKPPPHTVYPCWSPPCWPCAPPPPCTACAPSCSPACIKLLFGNRPPRANATPSCSPDGG